MREQILKNIRIIRENAGLSQEQMAFELDFSQSKYARFEDGRTKTDLESLIKFANWHKMDLIDLFLYPKKLSDISQKSEMVASICINVPQEKVEELLNIANLKQHK